MQESYRPWMSPRSARSVSGVEEPGFLIVCCRGSGLETADSHRVRSDLLGRIKASSWDPQTEEKSLEVQPASPGASWIMAGLRLILG